MVTIEDLSEVDIERREKHATLVGIARELFGERGVASNPRLTHAIFCQSDKIMVYTIIGNRIIVSDKDYFDDAVKLARAYEERTKESWTVKKDYAE